MKKSKRIWLWILVAVVFLAMIVIGSFQFRNFFNRKVNEERTQQLGELVNQVGVNFANTLDANWDFVVIAKNLAERYEYESRSDISVMANWLDEMTALRENDGFFMLLDDIGRCYDASDAQGVWVDFDKVGTQETATFIADSSTFGGYYWAFVQKLDKEILLTDGSASVCYVVLMRSVSSMESSFANSAYSDVGETYVLNENGVRMYDNLDSDDTLNAYNIFKLLRGLSSAYGNDFTAAEEELLQNGIASGDCVYNSKEYCYSLYKMDKYGTVLLFLLPADSIAVNTLDMASSVIRMLIFSVAMFMILLTAAFAALMNMQSKTRLLEQQERFNQELVKSNQSLKEAQKVTEQALAVAKSANKAKSSFLSNMSHDIRTPLNAILGFQKLLSADADEPEKVREYSGKIALAGNHLLALINDILDMSRIESGKTTLNSEPFELSKLIDDMGILMLPEAQARKQNLVIRNNAGKVSLMGDCARVNQILSNLLSNAIKYTPEGGRIEFITERLHASASQMAHIRFIVRDNGVGMGEEFQKRIFEPFTREESALVNGVSGTGLGMSITKNLVDLMGGIIVVESKRGHGSTFKVELSFCLIKPGESVPEKQDLQINEGVLYGRHFLLAEDNSINAEILEELLKMEGATCDVACNGKEAAERFCASAPGTYDAVLMDVQMPVMDGYGATQQIRNSKHPEAHTIPIAALTANAFAEDVQKALQAGMNTHISKPVDMKKLREFVAFISKDENNSLGIK